MSNKLNENGITDSQQDNINDISIRITNRLIKLGYVPDCGDTDDESEFEVQDLIREEMIVGLYPDAKPEDDVDTTLIQAINIIIEEYGNFTVQEVEAEHSPYISGDSPLVHLMEEFSVDGGRVRIYDPTASNSEVIDTYDADYEDLDPSQLAYVYKLALKWQEFMEE